MPQAPRRAPAARAPLTKDRVLQAGVRVADAHGFAAVSMRKVAEELGVEAMSLYHHVASKDELVDGMVDQVFAEIELPDAAAAWRPAMRARAASTRAVLARHVWALGLMDSRHTPGEATLRHHDAVIGSLLQDGFSLEAAAHTFSVLDSYVYGFVMQEASLPFRTPDELAAVTAGIAEHMDPDTYPHLTAMMGLTLRPGYSYADEFEVGLDLVLDGIARMADGAR